MSTPQQSSSLKCHIKDGCNITAHCVAITTPTARFGCSLSLTLTGFSTLRVAHGCFGARATLFSLSSAAFVHFSFTMYLLYLLLYFATLTNVLRITSYNCKSIKSSIDNGRQLLPRSRCMLASIKTPALAQEWAVWSRTT